MEDTIVHEVEVISPEDLNKNQLSGVSMQLDAAAKRPRNLDRIKSNLIFLVTMDEETAESCTYTVPRGKDNISGPSVHLANVVMQQWGNNRCFGFISDINEKTVVVQAVFWDLETNSALSISVSRRITDKTGARFSEDLITLTTNAAHSIARRNVILASIPRPFWKSAWDAARAKAIGDVSTSEKLASVRKVALDKLQSEFGVTVDQILSAVKKDKIGDIGVEELEILKGYRQSIKDGDSSVNSIFSPGKEANDNARSNAAKRMEEIRANKAKQNARDSKVA